MYYDFTLNRIHVSIKAVTTLNSNDIFVWGIQMAGKLGAAAKAVLNKGEGPKKIRTSFYISEVVKVKFFKMCEQRGIVPSEMIEALMRDAMDSL